MKQLAVLVLILLLPSCVVMRAEGDQMQSDIDRLKSEVATLQRNQRELEKKLNGKLDNISDRMKQTEKIGASTGADFERVMGELQNLRGQLEEAQHKLQDSPKNVSDAKDFPADKGEHFKLIDQLVSEKKYEDAVPAMEAYVERFGQDKEHLDQVYFWRGESYVALAKVAGGNEKKKDLYKRAILSYQSLLTQFPKSKLYSRTLLQVGGALEGMGFAKDARVFYEEILEKYPSSPQAKEAKKRIRPAAKHKK